MMSDTEWHVGIALQDIGELRGRGIVIIDFLKSALGVEVQLFYHRGKIVEHLRHSIQRILRLASFIVAQSVRNVVRLEEIGCADAENLASRNAHIMQRVRVAFLRHDTAGTRKLAFLEVSHGVVMRYCASRSDMKVPTVSAAALATLMSSTPVSMGEIWLASSEFSTMPSKPRRSASLARFTGKLDVPSAAEPRGDRLTLA